MILPYLKIMGGALILNPHAVFGYLLVLGQWEPGKGPERKIGAEKYGTVEINGKNYSWALSIRLKQEMRDILKEAEHPNDIRKLRLPGEHSTREKPTSLLENILSIGDGSLDSGILKMILRNHLENGWDEKFLEGGDCYSSPPSSGFLVNKSYRR
jgi:hypothetical protein